MGNVLLADFALAIITFSISWTLLYFFAPSFVRFHITDTGDGDKDKADPARCLIYSLLIVVGVLVSIYVIGGCNALFEKVDINKYQDHKLKI